MAAPEVEHASSTSEAQSAL